MKVDGWRISWHVRTTSNLSHLVNSILPSKRRRKKETAGSKIQSKWLCANMEIQLSCSFFPLTLKVASSRHCCLIFIFSRLPPFEAREKKCLPRQPSLRSGHCLSSYLKRECRSTNILQCFALYCKRHRAHLISHNPLLLLCVI